MGCESGALDTIVILDFGGQYTHLIARRVRALGVYSKIVEPEEFDPEQESALKGVILSGGPRSATGGGEIKLSFDLSALGVPLLGLCYGHQLIAELMGGRVESGLLREYGLTRVTAAEGGYLSEGQPTQQDVWMSHGDHVTRLPPGFTVTHSSPAAPVAGFENSARTIFGLQFHPEVTHTTHGMAMLERFVRRCAPPTWQTSNIVEHLVEEVRRQAGDRPLFLLVSGGVDSLVSLVLCIRAVGKERLTSLHVDTGFMRHGESAEVMDHLARMGFERLHVVEAQARFLRALEGVIDPEEKRKIIGRLFIEEVDRAIGELALPDDWALVQGTIYPDAIESGGSKHASTIKTHHNRVREIERLIKDGRVVEPICELYKDEVREVGLELGLPPELVGRHPFPGPGLAIRILCSDGRPPADYAASEPEALDLLQPFGLRGRLLPLLSVGVQGDRRTYQHPVVVWSEGGRLSWETLREATPLLVNRLEKVNRVVLSLTPLEERAYRLQATTLTGEAVALLQQVDRLVRQETKAYDEIWQAPVVSLPLLDEAGDRVFLARPICSRDAMTASPFPMEFDAIRNLEERAREIPGVGALWYDITDKPPATIEWE